MGTNSYLILTVVKYSLQAQQRHFWRHLCS